MKAKRFLSILVAVLMMVSCFVVGASAAVVKKQDKGTLNIHLYENAENLGLSPDDLTGTPADLAAGEYKGVPNVKFAIVQVADDAVIETGKTAKDVETLDGGKSYEATTNADGLASVTVDAGRYKVYATDKPANVGDPVAFLVDVPMTNKDGNGFNDVVDVYPKIKVTRDKPTVDKLVAAVVNDTEPDDEKDYTYLANLDHDQEASWRIVATVPTNIREFNKYELIDIVSDDLVIDPTSLTINGQKADADGKFQSYIKSAKFEGQTLTVKVDPKTVPMADIVVKFRTKIKDNKAGVEIPNHVTLVYNDSTLITNPDYDDTKPEDEDTNPKEVPSEEDDKTNNWKNPENYDTDTPGYDYDPYVWTGALKVIKVDDKGSKISTNEVEFELYKDDKTTLVTTLKTVDGEAYYTGLANGTYYLYETKAPAGYELNPTTVEVVIGPEFDTAKVSVNFENIPSTKLPLTGGMGVGIFALIGFAFAAVGGAFFFKSKKVSD